MMGLDTHETCSLTKYTKNKLCIKLGFLYTIIWRCTVNRTLKKIVGENLNILEYDAVPLRHMVAYQNIPILCNNHHSKNASRYFELQLRELYTFGTYGTTQSVPASCPFIPFGCFPDIIRRNSIGPRIISDQSINTPLIQFRAIKYTNKPYYLL